jgi:hypothetical protein
VADFPERRGHSREARADHLAVIKIRDQLEGAAAEIAHVRDQRAAIEIAERAPRRMGCIELRSGHERLPKIEIETAPD